MSLNIGGCPERNEPDARIGLVFLTPLFGWLPLSDLVIPGYYMQKKWEIPPGLSGCVCDCSLTLQQTNESH